MAMASALARWALWCSLGWFFFNDTATTEIYTLSLHDALPISLEQLHFDRTARPAAKIPPTPHRDRKSTRLNSSHLGISYAVFCLTKNIKTAVAVSSSRPCHCLPLLMNLLPVR